MKYIKLEKLEQKGEYTLIRAHIEEGWFFKRTIVRDIVTKFGILFYYADNGGIVNNHYTLSTFLLSDKHIYEPNKTDFK